MHGLVFSTEISIKKDNVYPVFLIGLFFLSFAPTPHDHEALALCPVPLFRWRIAFV
jgi:hypothetical protein